MKRTILEHHNQNTNPEKHKKRGLVESKGGICFEVDTRQFKGAEDRPRMERKGKKTHKATKINTK